MAKSNFDPEKGKQRLLPITSLLGMRSEDIRDVSSDFWFGPLQPVHPVTPASFRPRQWGFAPGSNIVWGPKADEGAPVDYQTLRDLADAWDLLRIIIEQQKDRICKQKWEVRAKIKPGESGKAHKQRSANDPKIKELEAFWARPDGYHNFRQWLRMWLEDMIVVDAVALYLARDLSGRIATVHPLAGDTINRQLTDQGITPPSPSVAYQQVLYGMPVWNFTTDDLVFVMRNERTNKRYGFGPVEQIINTVTFGLRRLEWQISEYTSGSTPEAMVFLPSDLPIDRVREVQEWFDSVLSGDLQNRRKVRFLPGYGTGDQAKPNVIFPKEALLKDDLDVWLAQIVCFCIGISPQPFMKAGGMNRATAAQAQETSEEEGLAPYFATITDVLNTIIQDKLGYTEYEMITQEQRELDVLKQAQADTIISGKILTINEVREDRGEDPRSEPEASMLGTFTPTGFIPLGGFPPGDPRAPQPKPLPLAAEPGGEPKNLGGGDQPTPPGKSKPNGKAPTEVPAKKMQQVLEATRSFVETQRKAVNYEALLEKVGADNVNELLKSPLVGNAEVIAAAKESLDAVPGMLFKGEDRPDLAPTSHFFGERVSSVYKRELLEAYKDAAIRSVIEERLDLATEKNIDPRMLHATQTWVQRNRVIEYLEGRESSTGASATMPWVVHEDGMDKILDGHHRLTSDILLGHELVTVKYTDLAAAQKILQAAALAKGQSVDVLIKGRIELLKTKPTKPTDGWIGVDFDNTLAVYEGDRDTTGAPIPKMVARVKRWLKDGEDVRIFTARVANDPDGTQRALIQAWCLQHLGQILPITATKNHNMLEYWDDKAVRVAADTGERLSPSIKKAAVKGQNKLEKKIHAFLTKTGKELAAKIRKHKVSKADWDPDEILKYIKSINWSALDVSEDLVDIATEAGAGALINLGLDSRDMISAVNDVASGWARSRAAELVGMKRNAAGDWVENPNPKWAISETTRDDLRDIVTKAFEKDTPIDELASEIQNSGSFSAGRAHLIADTEAHRAENQGNLVGWRESGVVEQVEIMLSGDHDVDDECDAAADEGPYDLDEVPDLPIHPGCLCAYRASKITGLDEESE